MKNRLNSTRLNTKKVKSIIIILSINILISFIVLELFLRLFPQFIPLEILGDFEPKMRAKIAKARMLPSLSMMNELQRDDDGPPLYLYKPNVSLDQPVDPIDIRYGAYKGVTQLDKQGFCNPLSYTKNSLDQNLDILTVGDSFTWCTTIKAEDSWSSQLRNISRYQIYNVARCCIGLYEELQIVKSKISVLNPKVVILAFYQGNDLRDALKYVSYRKYNHSEKNQNKTSTTFYKNSYIFSYILALLFRPALNTEIRDFFGINNVTFRYFINQNGKEIPFNQFNTDTDEIDIANKLENGTISLNVFNDGLQKFKDLSKKHNFLPLIVYIPSAYATYSSVRFNSPEIKSLIIDYENNVKLFFIKKTKDLDLSFIDTTENLKTYNLSNSSLAYLPANLHLSPIGHHTIAKQISRFLSSESRFNGKLRLKNNFSISRSQK